MTYLNNWTSNGRPRYFQLSCGRMMLFIKPNSYVKSDKVLIYLFNSYSKQEYRN